MPPVMVNPLPTCNSVANTKHTTSMNTELVMNKKKFAVMGAIRAVIPRMAVELTTTLPIKSPKAISECLLNIAWLSNTNSGRDVPSARKNNPINMEGAFSSYASKEPYRTTYSDA